MLEPVSSPRLRPHVRHQHAFRISFRASGRASPTAAAPSVGIRRPAPLDVEALIELARKLLTGRGEASGAATAAALLAGFDALAGGRQARISDAGERRVRSRSRRALQEAARAFLETPDVAHAADLLARAEPTRQELIRRLNHAPRGTLALVRMRETLLAALRKTRRWRAFDRDFRHLFGSWFNRGFLVLRRIEWTTPANILEKIIRYEAVHEISNWEELRRRLAPPDRRLLRLLPSGADRRAADLRRGRADAGRFPRRSSRCWSPIAWRSPPEAATTAVFYSISNAQAGLAGVSFGNFLIKQVVEDLRRELPRLQTFVTLSPVPGFARWLARGARQGRASRFVARRRAGSSRRSRPASPGGGRAHAVDARRRVFPASADGSGAGDRPGGAVPSRQRRAAGAHQPARRRLPGGLRQSLGVMVNYLYDLDDIEANHEAFANRGTVAASATVSKLAAGFAGKG